MRGKYMSNHSSTSIIMALRQLKIIKVTHATLVAFFVFSIFASVVPVSAGSSSVVINEINSAVIGDDWIELYNPTALPINVSNWSVHDTAGNVIKLDKFSSNTLLAGGYVTVEMDSVLNNPGDTITVYDSLDDSGAIIDTITYPATFVVPIPTVDKTASRKFDGSVDWVLQAPTKGTSNGSQASFESIPGTVGQTTTKVFKDDLANTWSTWTYHDDIKDSTDPLNAANPGETSNHAIVANPDGSSSNKSVVRLVSDGSQKFNLATLLWSGKKLRDLSSLKFDVYTNNTSGAYINMDINFNSWGADKWINQSQAYNHGRLVHVPTLTANTWSTHDPIADNDLWTWSQFDENGQKWPDGNTNELRTWKDITSSFPNAYISSTLKQFALAIIPYQQNMPVPFLPFGGVYLRADNSTTVHYDKVVLATTSSNVLYDFSQTSDQAPVPQSSPVLPPADQSNQPTEQPPLSTGVTPITPFASFVATISDGQIVASAIPQPADTIDTDDQEGDVLGDENSLADGAENFGSVMGESIERTDYRQLGVVAFAGLGGLLLLWWLFAKLRNEEANR